MSPLPTSIVSIYGCQVDVGFAEASACVPDGQLICRRYLAISVMTSLQPADVCPLFSSNVPTRMHLPPDAMQQPPFIYKTSAHAEKWGVSYNFSIDDESIGVFVVKGAKNLLLLSTIEAKSLTRSRTARHQLHTS